MYDVELLKDILDQVLASTKTIQARFQPIHNPSDFTDTPEGMEKLDAICMQLIALGESLKKVDKLTHQQLLANYPDVDWKGAKGLRDIIVHEYFNVDAEAIFRVCEKHIGPLANAIQKILQDLSSEDKT